MSPLDHSWTGLIDDAAIFPPGDAPLPDAVAAHVARTEEWYADLVRSFVVTDVRIPEIDRPLPLSIVISGGAGAIPGALRLAGRDQHALVGLEVALRDLDDLAGNARRVAAAVEDARGEGLLAEDVPTYVELPAVPDERRWLAAADVVAEAGLALKFRTGGLDAEQFPSATALAGWIDAALDRETRFKATAGLHRAVRHDPEGGGAHGFLNVMAATNVLWDGGSATDAAEALEQRDGEVLAAGLTAEDLSSARRWFTSFGSCSVTEPLDDLVALGLISPDNTMEQQ